MQLTFAAFFWLKENIVVVESLEEASVYPGDPGATVLAHSLTACQKRPVSQPVSDGDVLRRPLISKHQPNLTADVALTHSTGRNGTSGKPFVLNLADPNLALVGGVGCAAAFSFGRFVCVVIRREKSSARSSCFSPLHDVFVGERHQPCFPRERPVFSCTFFARVLVLLFFRWCTETLRCFTGPEGCQWVHLAAVLLNDTLDGEERLVHRAKATH